MTPLKAVILQMVQGLNSFRPEEWAKHGITIPSTVDEVVLLRVTQKEGKDLAALIEARARHHYRLSKATTGTLAKRHSIVRRATVESAMGGPYVPVAADAVLVAVEMRMGPKASQTGMAETARSIMGAMSDNAFREDPGGLTYLNVDVVNVDALPAGALDEVRSGLGHGERPCSACGAIAHRRCGGCRIVRYCNAYCQRIHWLTGHKDTCENIAAIARHILRTGS